MTSELSNLETTESTSKEVGREPTNMPPGPLDPATILKEMADGLPTHAKEDTTSDVSSSLEAIALFTHGCMVALGFRLLGFNEDQKIGKMSRGFSYIGL
jgi:hypothetical protein